MGQPVYSTTMVGILFPSAPFLKSSAFWVQWSDHRGANFTANLAHEIAVVKARTRQSGGVAHDVRAAARCQSYLILQKLLWICSSVEFPLLINGIDITHARLLRITLLNQRMDLFRLLLRLRRHVQMTSAKFSGFLTTPPLCLHFGPIHSTKFTQSPLIHLLLGYPPPPLPLQTSYVHAPLRPPIYFLCSILLIHRVHLIPPVRANHGWDVEKLTWAAPVFSRLLTEPKQVVVPVKLVLARLCVPPWPHDLLQVLQLDHVFHS